MISESARIKLAKSDVSKVITAWIGESDEALSLTEGPRRGMTGRSQDRAG